MTQSMKPYSEDLRRSIVRVVEDGTAKSTAARLFGVSLSLVKRCASSVRGGVKLLPSKGSSRPILFGSTAL
jgi:transposase